MTRILAALLFRFLALFGLVLHDADPEVPANTPADPVGEGAANPEGNADEGGAEDGQGDNADPNKPKGDTPQDERDKLIRKLERRIDRRSHAIGARDATIAELQAEVARLKGGGALPAEVDDDDTPPQGRVDTEERARELAAEMLEQRSIASRTRDMLEKGKTLENFREVAGDVAEVLPFVDSKGKPTAFIRAVLDTDNPAALLHHIGTNDDVLESLQGLTPTQLGIRLGKLDAKLAADKPAPARRSNAPTPLEPVSGRGNTARDERAMNDEEWRTWRLSQRTKA